MKIKYISPLVSPRIFCDQCKAECLSNDCSNGYAVRSDGKRICYACADAAQREELTDRSRPVFAYVSCGGRSIGTWTGGKLMDVISSRPCKLTRQSYTHDSKSYKSIRARDIHGKEWFGRGSEGICIKLKAVK